MLLSQVKGKDITELIASGREKLASVPSGGGSGPAVAAVAGAGAGAPDAAESKKEEKEEEKEEEDDVRVSNRYFFIPCNSIVLSDTLEYHLRMILAYSCILLVAGHGFQPL